MPTTHFNHEQAAQLAELPRSEFDPELFPHSAYVKVAVNLKHLCFFCKNYYFNNGRL